MVDQQKPEKVEQDIPAADTDVRHDPQLDTDQQRTTDRARNPSNPESEEGKTLVRPPDDTLPFLVLSSRYDIGKQLGKGGMGVVLLAKDRSLDREVAIKRILVPDPSSLARFITEARSIAALNHFNIVQIHEIARDSEGPFLVLEYVGGGSLLDRLTEGALDVEEAIQITCQMCDALTLAHDKGIIHRDIKPANILLTEEGHPKLTDFGLARDLESGSGQTNTGAGMGTPLYVPPEQWRDATSVDARSDLWSLAITCYQMITGSNPKVIRLDQLPATLARVIGTMLEENPAKRYSSAEEFKNELRNAMAASAGAISPDLVAGLCPACNTANNASRKFCRVCRASLMDPCLSCQTSNPVWEDICGECGHSQQENRIEIRNLLSASLEESLSFAREYEYEKALVQLATVQEGQYSFTEDIREQATDQIKLITSQRDEQHQLKEQLVQLAQKHLQKYDYAAAVRELKNIPAPLRRLDHAYADSALLNAQMSHDELLRLTEEIQQAIKTNRISGLLEKTTRYLQLKPNNEKLLALHEKLNAKADRDRAQIETLVADMQTAFDRHQDEIVLNSLDNWPDGLHRPPRAGELQELAHDRLGRVRDFKLAIATETKTSKKLRLIERYLLLRPADTKAQESFLCIKEERKEQRKKISLISIGLMTAGLFLILTVLLVHSSIKSGRVVRDKSDDELKTDISKLGPPTAPGLQDRAKVASETSDPEKRADSDRAKVASMKARSDAHRTKVASGTSAAEKDDHEPELLPPAQVPPPKDENFAKSPSRTETPAEKKARIRRELIEQMNKRRLAGSTPVWGDEFALTLTGHSHDVVSVSFSPDGKRIVSGSYDNTVKLWNAENGQELFALEGHSSVLRSVSFSPDGKRIVSGSSDKTAKVWDAETGQLRRTLSGHSGDVHSVSFSPDGRRIVSGSKKSNVLSTDYEVKVWDAENGRVMFTFATTGILNVSFRADGKQITDCGFGWWDANTGLYLGSSPGAGSPTDFLSGAMSLDGIRSVFGTSDNLVLTKHIGTGKWMHTFRGHSGRVWCVNFSPDGHRVASGSDDTTVKVWNAENGQELFTLKGHSHEVKSVSFSPDGKRIVTGSSDNTVKIWDLPPEKP